jgi:hypothetical protein
MDPSSPIARIEICDKWTETLTTLAKANSTYDPAKLPTLASDGRHVGNKKVKSLRDAEVALVPS